jgi:hypothetical protein
MVQTNNDLTELIKDLDKKCEFTDMSKLVEDKIIHNHAHKNLDDILEIARLPTTINTLIHKNDSSMAMKLINHFNSEIYDPRSEILQLIKKEIDILGNKIQQKLNIELEEGKSRDDEMQLLLGDNPSNEAIKDYIHKKYKVKMELVKQKLSSLFFSSKKNSEVKEWCDQVLIIFKEAFNEIQTQNEEEKLGFNNNVYKDLWNSTLIGQFADIILILLNKLSKENDNIKYLLDLKGKIIEVNKTTFSLIEQQIMNYIFKSAVNNSKTIASKVSLLAINL